MSDPSQDKERRARVRSAAAISRRTLLGLACGALLPKPNVHAARFLRLSHGYPSGSIVEAAAKRFADEMARTGDTRVAVQRIGSSDGFKELRAGGLDLWIGSRPAKQTIRALQVFDVPFVIRNESHLMRIFEKASSGPISKLFLKQGLHLVTPLATGAHVISSRDRPIRSPDMLKGLRVAVVGGDVSRDAFAQFGADPVRIRSTELMPALSKGFVDAYAGPLSTLIRSKLFEVQRHITMTRHVFGIAFLVAANKSISNVDGRATANAARDIRDFSISRARGEEKRSISQLRAASMNIVNVDPFAFEDFSKSNYDRFLSNVQEGWNVLSWIESLSG